MADSSIETLRNTQPSFLQTPNRNAGGIIQPGDIRGFGPFSSAPPDHRSHYQAPFPEAVAQAVTEQNIAGVTNIYSFQMDDASDNEGAKVLIHDGEVSANGADGQLPTGMGNDDFILPIAADGDDVWVELTYDTTTFAFTSLTIGTGSGIPNSSLGNAFFLLGYVVFNNAPPPSNKFLNTSPHNTQCGDINIAFMYGAFNAAPALFLLSQLDAPQPL